MLDRQTNGQKAAVFFEGLWQQGDFWSLESSEFEQAKYARELACIGGRTYPRALEIGCGAGCFTKQLALLAGQVVAVDIAPAAIARARQAEGVPQNVEFRVTNAMEGDLESDGPWDLIVMSETIYYLGWLYSFFDVAWFASTLFHTSPPGGRFLMTNTCGGVEDYLLRPWVIHTYRDLFLNVGYRIESEEKFSGIRDNAELEVLMSLFAKAAPSESGDPGTGQRTVLRRSDW